MYTHAVMNYPISRFIGFPSFALIQDSRGFLSVWVDSFIFNILFINSTDIKIQFLLYTNQKKNELNCIPKPKKSECVASIENPIIIVISYSLQLIDRLFSSIFSIIHDFFRFHFLCLSRMLAIVREKTIMQHYILRDILPKPASSKFTRTHARCTYLFSSKKTYTSTAPYIFLVMNFFHQYN